MCVYYICAWVCVCVSTCHRMHVEVRGQLFRVSFLFFPLHGLQGLNFGSQARRVRTLPPELSHQYGAVFPLCLATWKI